MKRKLVKRPLREYGFGKKGDVYGYDWGSWFLNCWDELATVIGAGVATGAAAYTGQVAVAVAGAVATAGAYKQYWDCTKRYW